jgi:hypothetical protein
MKFGGLVGHTGLSRWENDEGVVTSGWQFAIFKVQIYS